MGPTKDAMKFFHDIGYPCPHLYNPADHYIQNLAILPSKVTESHIKVKQICDGFQNSSYCLKIKDDFNELKSNTNSELKIEFNREFGAEKATKFCQIRWLLWRQYLSSFRDPVTTKGFIIQTLVRTNLSLKLAY